MKTVNAEEVRGRSLDAQEFGDFGTHCQFNFIPKGEIWIADNVTPAERPFMLDAAATQLDVMAKGGSADKAYDRGLAVERAERERAGNASGQARKYPAGAVDKELWKTIDQDGEQVRVYLVDGEEVRNRFKTDFIEGGHGYVYPWVPKDEIWLEGTEHKSELPALLLHEAHERKLMKDEKMSYAKAHEKASAVEFKLRQRTQR